MNQKLNFGNYYSIIKPLFWFILFQILVFLVLVILPQSYDVYMYLFEDGFWENFLQIFLLLFSLIFLSCTSGVGGKIILAVSNIPEDKSEDGKKIRIRFMLSIVSFLWYFPFISFALGFYNALIKGGSTLDATNILWTIIFTIICYFAINRIRFLLRKFVEEELILIAKKYKKPDRYFINKFDSLGGILKDETYSKPNSDKNDYTITNHYRPLLRVISLFIAFSLTLLLVLGILSVEFYAIIGAGALVVFGLGVWITIYYGIEILDTISSIPIYFNYANTDYHLSLKLIILIWVLFCSYTNQDHPLREFIISENEKIENYQPLQTLSDKFKNFNDLNQKDSICTPKDSVIIFVAVDGGASRTGLFGAMMLSKIQDITPSFKDKIFGFSNISGGTLGANIFYSLTQYPINDTLKVENTDENANYSSLTKKYFKGDFLSPIIGVFLFGDIVGYFLPFYVEKFDRGVALEKGWEKHWNDIMPYLKDPYNKDSNEVPHNNAIAGNSSEVLRNRISTVDSIFKPVMLINSFEVETGKRAIFSNIKLDEKDFSGISNLNEKIGFAIPYSTAILLSARFPFASPSAAIKTGNTKRHYVDGGYFEASGTLSLYELVRSLENSIKKNYQVYVIHCEYDESEEDKKLKNYQNEVKGNSFLNEFTDILTGAINDKSGHADFAEKNLENYIKNVYGSDHFITLSVGASVKDVPLNWVLSNQAIKKAEKQCESRIKDNKDLKKLIEILNCQRSKSKSSNQNNSIPTK